MEDKYKALSNDIYFGFEIFDDILKAIDGQRHPEHDMFNAGIASADGAIRRLREEYYNAITKTYEETN